jgi:hypothetical protein
MRVRKQIETAHEPTVRIGHCPLGIFHSRTGPPDAQCPMPNAQCPMVEHHAVLVHGPNTRPKSEVRPTHEPGVESAHLTPALSPLGGRRGRLFVPCSRSQCACECMWRLSMCSVGGRRSPRQLRSPDTRRRPWRTVQPVGPARPHSDLTPQPAVRRHAEPWPGRRGR